MLLNALAFSILQQAVDSRSIELWLLGQCPRDCQERTQKEKWLFVQGVLLAVWGRIFTLYRVELFNIASLRGTADLS